VFGFASRVRGRRVVADAGDDVGQGDVQRAQRHRRRAAGHGAHRLGLLHQHQSTTRDVLAQRVANADDERHTVVVERMERQSELIAGLRDWNQVAAHFDVHRFVFKHLRYASLRRSHNARTISFVNIGTNV
jgi:hypothetical protein